MRFSNPFYFLLLVPAALFFLLYLKGKIGKEAVLRFSSLSAVKSTGVKKLGFRRFFPALLRFSALVLVIFALARPQSGIGEEKTTQQVIDIVIALDVSGSMATLDFHPGNRLTAAKLEARQFIEGRKGDRLGLVIFGGQSFTVCPLTVDHQALLSLLETIQFGMVEDGTAIGVGLGTAINRLKDSEAKSRVIVLLTDGVNNTGEIDPLTAASLARQYGIKVHIIGVGKEGMALLPVNDPVFGTRLINFRTQIDEKMMTRIAESTGGAYFRAQDERALREIFKLIDKMEKTEVKIERYTHYEEHYFWFLWSALFLLACELLWTSAVFVKIP